MLGGWWQSWLARGLSRRSRAGAPSGSWWEGDRNCELRRGRTTRAGVLDFGRWRGARGVRRAFGGR